MKRFLAAVVLLCFGVISTSCKNWPLKLNEYENKHNVRITLRLLWYAQSQFAGYYVARELGYYADEGIDVEIVPSIGAGDILSVVGSEDYQFGITQLSNLIRAIDHSVPVKSIAQIVQTSNLVLLARTNSNIRTVQDFKGKVLSTWWGKQEFMSRILLQMNGMKQEDLRIYDDKYWSSDPFASGKADLITAMMYNEYNTIVFKDKTPATDFVIFPYKEYGLNFPEDTLFTSQQMIDSHPDICRKFLKATLKGWMRALSNKDEAIKIILRYAVNTDYEEQIRQLVAISPSILPSGYSIEQIGAINPDSVQNMINIMSRYGVISGRYGVDEIYDRRFAYELIRLKRQ